MAAPKSLTIRLSLVLLCLCMASWSFAQGVVRLDPYEVKYEPGVVLVKFEEEVDIPITKERRLGKVVVTGIQKTMVKYGIKQGEPLFPQAKRGEKLGKVLGFSGEEIEVESLYNIFKLEFVPEHDAKTVAEELARQEGVVYAEPDYLFYALGAAPGRTHTDLTTSGFAKPTDTTPNDPLYGDQWYLPAVNAPAAWDSTTGDTTQVIGIIDTGVDWDHPDLDDNIWRNWDEIPDNGVDDDSNGFVDDIRGWDFVNHDNNPNDDNSHGTHVAGIAAAEGNNGVGICGVAWNAKIMPVKMLQSSGQGSSSDLASAINYAANNGATVINMSLGSYGESQTVKTALENAYSTAVFVAAAGNDGYKVDPPFPPSPIYAPMYPACYSFVIGIEATTNSGSRASFSNLDPSGPSVANNNYGHNYEIKAPGVSIYSTFSNGNYHYLNGTSMASPIIAGAVVLLKSYNATQSTEQIFARLIQGANSGILDIGNSLDYELVPDLHYVEYTLTDTLPSCDNDGIADAGETIELYLTVKNAGGFADSVWSKLRLDQFEDPSVATITDSTSQIGDISAYATMTGEIDPFRIEIDPDVVNNRDIVFECEIGAANHSSFTGELIITVQNGIELSGIYAGLTTLYPNREYIITQSVVFDSLIIKPGVVLKFGENNGLLADNYFICSGKPDSMIVFTRQDNSNYSWGTIKTNSQNTIMDYCLIEYGKTNSYHNDLLNNIEKISNSILRFNIGPLINNNDYLKCYSNLFLYNYNNIAFISPQISNFWVNNDFKYNIVSGNTTCVPNNPTLVGSISDIDKVAFNTFLSNQKYDLGFHGQFEIIELSPNYFGANDTTFIGERTKDYFEDSGMPALLLNNIMDQPSDSTHGIVWKVEINDILVNKYDNPHNSPTGLGVVGAETLKFDVYFNRAMDTTYTPFLTFGVREPYTQHLVSNSAFWSADSTVWTAYHTVGLETGDGINGIRVANAKDTDHFEIPVEDTRFQFVIQAAGAASNQFMASTGVGKVELEWPGAPTDDALGYNMYRCYNLTDSTFSDTLRINTTLITDTTYTDFDVIPDTTYHYMYKVLGTDMAESDYSKSVAATPVSASSGDANGDMTVNVLDIVAIVNYILEENPQPFLLEAADVNGDGSVNVLDIVGVVNIILGAPKRVAGELACDPASLTLSSDGILLNSPVPVYALQFTLTGKEMEQCLLKPTDVLNGFEIGKNETDARIKVVVYNLNGLTVPEGEHLLFQVEGGKELQITEAIFVDRSGALIPTGVDAERVPMPDRFVLYPNYPNPFNAITRIKFALPKPVPVKLLIYNILGQRVKSFHLKEMPAGVHGIHWDGKNDKGLKVGSGLYFYHLDAGEFVDTKKMILLR